MTDAMPHLGPLSHEDAISQPAEVLATLRARAADRSEVITVWKDGTWKRWLREDDLNAQAEDDWLSVIPAEELSQRLALTSPSQLD